MTITAGGETTVESSNRFEPTTPFAEPIRETPQVPRTADFVPWTESLSPFADTSTGGIAVSAEQEALAEEIFEALHDESFDEALAQLVGETAEAVDQRLVGESATALLSERQRLGDGHLSPTVFESEQYIERLNAGLVGIDITSLPTAQLDEVLDRFDPPGGSVSPAGEEFLGALVRKAKGVVRTVARAAGKVAKIAMPLLGPVLNRLKSLIRPLLRRVLAVAINRLPGPLQEPARALAKRFGLSESAEGEAFQTAQPVAVGDPEALAHSFDAALTEALLAGDTLAEQGETFGYEYEDEQPVGESPLEALAEARGDLVEKLGAADNGEDMTPVIEQFIPALLPALRLGIRLVGRPKVVSFLAGYLARLISQWVGPSLARPLSTAIVDTGLRLVTLEQPEPGESETEAAPAVLASTIEDTVRRLTESEDYVFEDEDLLQLAVGDAFEEAVATNFPAQFVRPELRVAVGLPGSFLPRFHRQVFAYKKYWQVPEVEVTAAIAQSLRTFGGVTLADALRASGKTLPLRARVHVYEATVGTTLPRLARLERVPGLGSHRAEAFNRLHPLTPEAAAVLLREPRLGVRKPAAFLRSRHRIAVGQRFYYLEAVHGQQASDGAASPRRGTDRSGRMDTPSRSAITIDLRSSEVLVRMFFSEVEAQTIASTISRSPASPALLKALTEAYDRASQAFTQEDGVRILKESEDGEAELGSPQQRVPQLLLAHLRRALDAWAKTMLAQWARARGQEFVRAAQNAAQGVTVDLRLRGVPGLNLVRQAMRGQLSAQALRSGDAFRGTPNATVTVTAGRVHR